MLKVNNDCCRLPGDYLFKEVGEIVSRYSHDHPEAKIIRMGIGDVTRPLCQAAVEAIGQAAAYLSKPETFRGYGPEQGHEFLRTLIAVNDYQERGIKVNPDEIFVSDGAKSDLGNIFDILAPESRVAITDPVYPAYVDTTVMGGRAGRLLSDGHWSDITYLRASAESEFVPMLPDKNVDVIYLCNPNNPTGIALTREQLTPWIDYCRRHGSLLLYDAAYEAYVTRPDVPRSIYELPGARQVAIEFRSFSKTAGFTGVRLGYTVVPDELVGLDGDGNPVSLRRLWLRRQSTKFNGASYISQCAAAALYTPEGRRQVEETINYYHANARMLRDGMNTARLQSWGGVDSPYVWVKTPDGMNSWQFFHLLLEQCQVVCTPGVGFGPAGEGYVRFTAFNSDRLTAEAVDRISALQF